MISSNRWHCCFLKCCRVADICSNQVETYRLLLLSGRVILIISVHDISVVKGSCYKLVKIYVLLHALSHV